MYKTQNAVKNYFDLLIKENVKEKEVTRLQLSRGDLKVITNSGKTIKINYVISIISMRNYTTAAFFICES
jgi:hypothetical protein